MIHYKTNIIDTFLTYPLDDNIPPYITLRSLNKTKRYLL